MFVFDVAFSTQMSPYSLLMQKGEEAQAPDLQWSERDMTSDWEQESLWIRSL